MIPVRDLFESHLTVVDLQRSMTFFSRVLGLELAEAFLEQKVAFYWIGGRGTSMLGLWEVGTGPQRLSLHVAFRSDLGDLLSAPGEASVRWHCPTRLLGHANGRTRRARMDARSIGVFSRPGRKSTRVAVDAA